jgi:D-alanyl-D-alanine carboxypeptidase/D-alanyl-D-alanine-endopeptidase (penicillin-binding protein 4)
VLEEASILAMPERPATLRSDFRPSRRDFACAALALGAGLAVRPARADGADAALTRAAEKALAELATWVVALKARITACVVDVKSGRVVAEASAHQPLNPASNQKLLTMVTALEKLGPEYRFTTGLHGRPTGDGTLAELILRSDGDPELTLAELEQLVRGLRAQGVAQIAGNVWIDQSAFDSAWDPPAYEQRPADWAPYRAPVSAVALEGNSVMLHVLAGAKPGPARTWFTPEGLVSARGEIKTVEAPGKQDIQFGLRANGADLEANLGGTVLAGRPELTFLKRIAAPELAAGRALLRLLADHGIRVDGSLVSGGADIDAERVNIRSRQLSQLLFALGKHSDNFVAEMLLKAIGRVGSSASGSSGAGAARITELLQRLGALEPGTQIRNGSGLFDANRVSAFSLARVLASALGDPRVGPDLVGALAIGGVDGTLRQRFSALKAERSLRAKTGTLAEVTALSGYLLRPQSPAPLAFAVLVNGASGKGAEVRRRIDEAVLAIARAIAPL